ncbi:hypothetical protein GCM10020220_062390 [Nonomuraea rubra]
MLIAAGISLVTLVLIDPLPLVLAHVGMAAVGLGIGVLHPTVSVLVLEMSKEGEEGNTHSAAVGVGESVFTVVAVAVSGALFTAAAQNYAVGLVFTIGLALLGAVLAPRSFTPGQRALWREPRHKGGTCRECGSSRSSGWSCRTAGARRPCS